VEKPKAGAVEASCDCEAFHKLESFISGPEFLKTLEGQCGSAAVNTLQELELSDKAQLIHDATSRNLSNSDFNQSEPTSAASASPSVAPEQPGTQSGQVGAEDYIVIDKEDAVEALAYYLASYLVKLPEAQAMPPKKLQEAIVTAMHSLKQSRFKQLCAIGRHVYRWSALTYSALQMYQNPWLIQAILTAIWTFSRLSLRAYSRAPLW